MTLSNYLVTLFPTILFTVGFATLYSQIQTESHRRFERMRNLDTWWQHVPQITFVVLTLLILRIIEISLTGPIYWAFINMEAVILIFSNLIAQDLIDFILIQVVGLYIFTLTGAITWVTGPIYILGSILVYAERWYGPKLTHYAFLYYLPPILLGSIFWLAIGIEYHDSILPITAFTNDVAFAISCIELANFDRFQQRDQQIIMRLQHEVQYDGLTQIRNWSMFQRDLSKAFTQRHNSHGLALLTLDLDHFKNINDSHGHLIGNQALVLVASRLNHELGQLNQKYHVYRTGGEEFAIILPGADEEVATKVAQQCATMIRGLSVHIRSGELRLTASFGVAINTSDDTNATHLYKRADKYLYQSKNAGRDKVSVEGKLIINEQF